MLYHLRQRIATTLAPARCATLASHGPAGLQAQLFPCVARDLQLYLLLPSTSDHLLNLESSPSVVVATAEWQVRGRARVLGAAEREAAGVLLDAPDAPGARQSRCGQPILRSPSARAGAPPRRSTWSSTRTLARYSTGSMEPAPAS